MRPTIVYSFLAYEMKRSLARKKVIVLVAFLLLLDTVPYYALSQSASSIIPTFLYGYIWIAGVLIPQPLFIQFVAIFIAAGAMSEEYEQGTAELLMSKPVSRMEYVTGKFLGGYILLLLILILSSLVSLLSAFLTFGTQYSLEIVPGELLATAYAALLFFTMSFMFGELLRRSSLAYIFSSAVLFTSLIVGVYLGLIFTLTGNEFYKTVQVYLPTSAVDSLPVQYMQGSLPSIAGELLKFLPISGGVESLSTSMLLVFIYSIVASAIFLIYFSYADISRRVS